MGVVLLTNNSCDKCMRYHLCKERNDVEEKIQKLVKEFEDEQTYSGISKHTHILKLHDCENFKWDGTPIPTQVNERNISPFANSIMDDNNTKEYIIRKNCDICDFREKCINYNDRDECRDFLMRLTYGTPFSFNLTWVCSGLREEK